MKSIAQRRITLLRHAKAVADDLPDGDHARALNERGQGDAAAMGDWLRNDHPLPDLVLCSTAERTKQTFAALKLQAPVEYSDKLYLASAGEMFAMLQDADDTLRHVMLIGHNPGMHALAALLVRSYAREEDADALLVKFPTSALASMTVDIAYWKALAPHSAHVDVLRVGRGE